MIVTFDDIKVMANVAEVLGTGFNMVESLVNRVIDTQCTDSFRDIEAKACMEKISKMNIAVAMEDDCAHYEIPEYHAVGVLKVGGDYNADADEDYIKATAYCKEAPMYEYYGTILDYLTKHYDVSSVEI